MTVFDRVPQLVIGITDSQAEQHPITASFIEPLGAGEQQFADPIERVVFAAAMAERLVLDPSTHGVAASVRDPHDMERVGNTDGVIQVRRQASSERLRQIRRDDFDARQPGRIGVAVHFRRSTAALPSTMSITRRASRSTSPVA